MKKQKAFTLIEMLVVVAIIALLIAILLPSLSKARELSRQTACSANMKGIGTSCYIYQSDNLDVWPTSPFATEPNEPDPIVEYIENMGGGAGGPDDPDRETMSRSGPIADGGTVKVSTTRSFWLMVRSGSIVPKNFLCPSSQDSVDPTVDVTTYFDFVGFGTCSYGYQIPYDNANTSPPSADVDPRMVLVADRSPWSSANLDQPANGGTNNNPNFFVDTIDNTIAQGLYTLLTSTNQYPPDGLNERSTPDQWKRFNSPNHGGLGQGRGQNMLYPDGHAEFLTKPLGGVDLDNVYTQMSSLQGQGTEFRRALQWGARPTLTGIPVYPGDGSLEGGPGDPEAINSTTDTLVWP